MRVGDVVSDTAPPPAAPVRQFRFDQTEAGAAKFATLTEFRFENDGSFQAQTETLAASLGLDLPKKGLLGHDIYESIYNPGKSALLLAWRDEETAKSWTPNSFKGVQDLRHRVVRVVREYGMFDRREAPQYFPEVGA